MNNKTLLKILSIICALLFSSYGFALPQGIYTGTVVRIVDGDTVEVEIDKYLCNTKHGKASKPSDKDKENFTRKYEKKENVTIRLSLIDAPEQKYEKGKACTEYLNGILEEKEKITMHVVGGAAFDRTSAIIWKGSKKINASFKSSINAKIVKGCKDVTIMPPKKAIDKKYANVNLKEYIIEFYRTLKKAKKSSK